MSREQCLRYLRSLDVFKSFPDQIREKIADFTYIREYSPKDRVLIQGQENSDLYFLLMGQVGVLVDGGIVATMEQMGDLIGEMSVISQEPVSATIVAETPVKILIVNSQKMLSTMTQEDPLFELSLYKAYARSLIEKLRLTNQKAKYFEDVNKSRLSEIYIGQELTYKKLKEVTDKRLTKLSSRLELVRNTTPSEDVQKAIYEVKNIVNILKPITHRFHQDKTMKSKAVLLAESNRKQQTVAKLALGGTGIDLVIANNIEEAEEALDKSGFDIVFVNSEMLDLLSNPKYKGIHFVLLTSDPIPSYIPKLKSLDRIPHIVSRDYEDRTFTTKNIITTVGKIGSDDYFGLEKYLAWGVEVREKEVTGSTMRVDLNYEMQQYFHKLGIRRSLLDPVVTVAEEILMNAIYDAPTDNDGKPIYNHLARTEKIGLKSEEYALFRYAMDGMLMAISVQDPFGALKGETILAYLESCYSGQAGSLNLEKGGAGRGLHMIVELSDLVVFNIKPRVKTEVICLFHVDQTQKHEKATSFHYFCDV